MVAGRNYMKPNSVNFLILLFSLGILAGWLLRDRISPIEPQESQLLPEVVSIEPQTDMDTLVRDLNEGLLEQAMQTAQHLIDDGRSQEINRLIETTAGRLIRERLYLQAKDLLERYYGTFNATLQGLILLARSLEGTGEHRQQIATLLQAQLLADTEANEEQISSLLTQAVNHYSRFLIAANRWGDLDLFYQELISAQPENSHHYLQLGLLRMRVGDLDGATDPLSRIEHDPLLGEQARQMMAKAQRKSELVPIAAAEVPLTVRGSQYIVTARLDNYRDVNLLIDTGATITVIDPRLLVELGYNLDGEVQYFNTANGTIQAPMVDIQDLSVGSVTVKELPVAAVNVSLSREIDGLLGMNFLRHYQFRIDQNSNLLLLNPRRR